MISSAVNQVVVVVIIIVIVVVVNIIIIVVVVVVNIMGYNSFSYSKCHQVSTPSPNFPQ